MDQTTLRNDELHQTDCEINNNRSKKTLRIDVALSKQDYRIYIVTLTNKKPQLHDLLQFFCSSELQASFRANQNSNNYYFYNMQLNIHTKSLYRRQSRYSSIGYCTQTGRRHVVAVAIAYL